MDMTNTTMTAPMLSSCLDQVPRMNQIPSHLQMTVRHSLPSASEDQKNRLGVSMSYSLNLTFECSNSPGHDGTSPS